MPDVTTRADGGSAASQASDLDERSWTARPFSAFAIRALVFLAPILGSVAVTFIYRAVVPSPSGLAATVSWWMGAIAVVMLSMRWFERRARKLMPVVVLFRMSLVFPDEAPSRFRTALKTGTTRQLQRQIEDAEADAATATPNEAAETLLTLMSSLSCHDRLTRGHSERVRGYTDLIAEEMGLPTADRQKLHWAALIHDVGKLHVPAAILNKKGRPTDAEWDILKVHPGAGEALVDPLRDWLGEWALATTQHHERFDGKGYPQGLAGHDISLAGRIVAVADAYDVMTSARSYKKALPPAQARLELARNSGTQFDPDVVKAFLAVGLTRTRAVYGPLAWLTEVRSLAHLPSAATTTVGTAASAAVGAAAVTVGSVMAVGGPALELSAAEPLERLVVEAEPASDGADTGGSGATGSAVGAETDSGTPLAVPAETSTTTTSTTTTSTTPTEPTTTEPTTTEPTTTEPTTTEPTTTTTTVPPTTTTTATTTTTTTTTTPPGPPDAVDDFATVGGGTTNHHVLTNDLENGNQLHVPTLVIVVAPTHAALYSVNGDHLRYRPVEDYEGSDQMTYRICDTGAMCDTATLYLTVEN